MKFRITHWVDLCTLSLPKIENCMVCPPAVRFSTLLSWRWSLHFWKESAIYNVVERTHESRPRSGNDVSVISFIFKFISKNSAMFHRKMSKSDHIIVCPERVCFFCDSRRFSRVFGVRFRSSPLPRLTVQTFYIFLGTSVTRTSFHGVTDQNFSRSWKESPVSQEICARLQLAQADPFFSVFGGVVRTSTRGSGEVRSGISSMFAWPPATFLNSDHEKICPR